MEYSEEKQFKITFAKVDNESKKKIITNEVRL